MEEKRGDFHFLPSPLNPFSYHSGEEHRIIRRGLPLTEFYRLRSLSTHHTPSQGSIPHFAKVDIDRFLCTIEQESSDRASQTIQPNHKTKPKSLDNGEVLTG